MGGGGPIARARCDGQASDVALSIDSAAVQRLTTSQQAIIRHFISMLNTNRDSVVITNPLAPESPIVHVTQAWQDMCGYTSQEAVGRNPRLTQGENSDTNTIRQMKHAVCARRACKVRIINYRGHSREPFWNCLTMHPIFSGSKLVLFAARLQDYSYRLNSLMSLTPTQFCKVHEQLQCSIRLSRVQRASNLSSALRIDSDLGPHDEAEQVGESIGTPKSGTELLPTIPTQHVKRLTLVRLNHEPEYLSDRLRDECEKLQLSCQAAEMVSGGTELMRLEVHQASQIEGGEGVLALLHVMPEDMEGGHCISFTRLSGDTFQFHALFRSIKKRLSDLVQDSPPPS